MWIALAFSLNGMYTVVNQYLLFKEKTHIISMITICTILFSMLITYVLITLNGVIGAAQGVAFTYLARLLVTWIISHKSHPMPWFSKLNMIKN